MKYLVLLLVLVLGYALWRNQRTQPPPARTPSPQNMVACTHCGIHLPRTEAMVHGTHYYCCAEHQPHDAH